MHSHNHDLIAALAEGLLADGLIAAAEADFAACDECAAELASQRSALNALSSLKAPSMTASESSQMRQGVATALGLAEAPAPQSSRRSRRSPWAAIAFAAGLAGVLAIVPTLGLIDFGGNDDADSSSETVAAAVFEQDEGASMTEELALADDVATSVASGTEMAATVPPQSEAPMAATESTEALAVTTTLAMDLGQQEQTALTAVEGEAAIRDLFKAGPTEGSGATNDPVERTELACSGAAEQAFGNTYLHVPAPASLDDGSGVILYAAADWSALIAFDLDECTPVLSLP